MFGVNNYCFWVMMRQRVKFFVLGKKSSITLYEKGSYEHN
jgi:hypothetical protein